MFRTVYKTKTRNIMFHSKVVTSKKVELLQVKNLNGTLIYVLKIHY